jgi:lipopolysaccharide/colanic/teichoic acid biosynthesis glycosyltransferase
MIECAPSISDFEQDSPTLWGLSPIQLYDRFWSSRGVCIVRPGGDSELPEDAEIFMLSDASTLVVFRLRNLLERLYWVGPTVLFVRLHSAGKDAYRESIVTDPDGNFMRIERHYNMSSAPTTRLVLTRNRRVAALWQRSNGSDASWRQFRKQTKQVRRESMAVRGRCYDGRRATELDECITDLLQIWRKPAATIRGLRHVRGNVWAEINSALGNSVRFLGPTWIGAGRSVPDEATVIGPAVLWDEPGFRLQADLPSWSEIEPTSWPTSTIIAKQHSSWRKGTKRLFDILFSLVALLFTLPLYPFLMLMIWIEDGRPFFFAHKRETIGGREFNCIKFRSMRKDADAIKRHLIRENQSDGPQFFIENDPRVTRTGRFMRKHNFDELPQFLNVLAGQMSVVGPRPSPRHENQCCPSWRESRLSVRPGITGLWQVSRSRQQGLDFQEWIRFDIEYVRTANWWLDLKILLKTFRIITGV